jgi:CheY-like chemotaxis protein
MSGNRPSVVLAVDEQATREQMSGVLREAGFTVVASEDREAVLHAVEREPVDLAVVDLDRPGRCEARDLIRRARQQRPELKALFVAQPTDPAPADDPRRSDIVVKPIAPREFLGCVLELLLRDDDEADDRRRYEAEFGLAQAHIGCLQRRRAAAGGDPALAQDLARDLERAQTAARGLRDRMAAVPLRSVASAPAPRRARSAAPRVGGLRRRP